MIAGPVLNRCFRSPGRGDMGVASAALACASCWYGRALNVGGGAPVPAGAFLVQLVTEAVTPNRISYSGVRELPTNLTLTGSCRRIRHLPGKPSFT